MGPSRARPHDRVGRTDRRAGVNRPNTPDNGVVRDWLGRSGAPPGAACADAAGDLAACVLPAYGGAAIAVTELVYGPGGPIADANARSCQSALGKSSVGYVAAATKAIQGCLDKINKGTLSGDAATLCLGSLAPGGVVAPTDPATARKLAKAEDKLRATIAEYCADGTCAKGDRVNGECRLVCDPAGAPACNADSDCPQAEFCKACPDGSCANTACPNGSCQVVCGL